MTTLSLLDKINRLTGADLALITQILDNCLLSSPSQSECLCHFIDANKTRILMWKHKTLPNTYLLKINDQLFISSYRTDKNGETYWKYRNFYEKEVTAEGNPPLELNALEKFSQRQTKTREINHEPNSTNPSEPTQ